MPGYEYADGQEVVFMSTAGMRDNGFNHAASQYSGSSISMMLRSYLLAGSREVASTWTLVFSGHSCAAAGAEEPGDAARQWHVGKLYATGNGVTKPGRNGTVVRVGGTERDSELWATVFGRIWGRQSGGPCV